MYRGEWVHVDSGVAACPRTYAAPGREFIPDHEWVPHATDVLAGLNQPGRPWSGDDVWAELKRRGVLPPRDRRLLGTLIRNMRSDGLILPLNKRVLTRQPDSHGQPITVWVAAEQQGVVTRRAR